MFLREHFKSGIGGKTLKFTTIFSVKFSNYKKIKFGNRYFLREQFKRKKTIEIFIFPGKIIQGKKTLKFTKFCIVKFSN
jgi:hypothetical protein